MLPVVSSRTSVGEGSTSLQRRDLGASRPRGRGVALVLILVIVGFVVGISRPASAAPALTIEPITWNVIGLTSVQAQMLSGDGPDTFATGARICNTGTTDATNVQADLVWDSVNAYIDLVAGSPSTLTLDTLVAGDCADFYFNIEIQRDASAYDTSRECHIEATADTLGLVSTPTPRDLYVEHLVSQNRNSVVEITGPGGPGDPPATSVLVGQTYTYKMYSDTATNGYEQLTSFLDFPNVIFQVLSVDQTYTAPVGGTNDTIYADACGWVSDPADPDYWASPGPNDPCAGADQYVGGKAGGSVETTYVVKVLSTGTTTVNALIYDFSGSSFHYNSDFGSSIASVTITAEDPDADLSITKTDDVDPVILGDQVTYTLDVANAGPADATNVSVTDTLDPGMSFDAATPSQGTCAEALGVVTCDLGGLAAGATASIDITLTTTAVGLLTDTADVAATETDPDLSNNSASESTRVAALTDADLSITKMSDVSRVSPGDAITYTLNVTNDGPADATNVTVVDPLPAGLSFDAATPSQGTCAEALGVVTCDLGGLANGASASIDIVVTAGGEGAFTNTASVSADETDPVAANNVDGALVRVRAVADLSVRKTVDITEPTVDDAITYTVRVRNEGPDDATNVVIGDLLPEGLRYVRSDASRGSYDPTTGEWLVGNLAFGDSARLRIVAQVTAAGGTAITNVASVLDLDQMDPDPSGDEAVAAVVVRANATTAATGGEILSSGWLAATLLVFGILFVEGGRRRRVRRT